MAAVHTRSVVAVADVDSYAAEPQAVSTVHTRSDVLVAAVVSYSEVLEHTVRPVHTESSVVELALLM